ncbi:MULTISPECIES: hypothetical protein [unclassified Thiocapsa]|uniref:hypothetical protein n=1 Tax=unclassified Thiocapsa TaxID=2641286 RepID=UPI0035AF2D4E
MRPIEIHTKDHLLNVTPRDLLTPLQAAFSQTAQGQQRQVWFVYTLLAVAVPFTSSITSNVLRALRTLFGLKIESQRFDAFMASSMRTPPGAYHLRMRETRRPVVWKG